MKAKTLMGMIACASACVSLSAFGNTTNHWFDVTASGSSFTPSDNTTATTNSVNVTEAENGKLVLDNDSSCPLVIATTASSALSDNVVKISGVALLTPSSTNNFEVTTGAKAGFAVGIDDNNATNFYGFANGAWVKLMGDASNADTQDTTFSLVLDYRAPNVRFYVGDTQLAAADGGATEFALSSGSSFTAIDAFGSGSITSITGSYEVAVAAYGDNKYGSIAEATAAARAESVADPTTAVRVVNSDGTTEVAGTPAANGLSKIVCAALGLSLDESSANIAVAPVGTDIDKNNITLAVNLPDGAEPDAVGFKISGSDMVHDYNAIKIPITTPGTYTITPVLK